VGTRWRIDFCCAASSGIAVQSSFWRRPAWTQTTSCPSVPQSTPTSRPRSLNTPPPLSPPRAWPEIVNQIVRALRRLGRTLVAEKEARIAGQSTVGTVAARLQAVAGRLHRRLSALDVGRLDARSARRQAPIRRNPKRRPPRPLGPMGPFVVHFDDDLHCILDDVAGGQHNHPAAPLHQRARANGPRSHVVVAEDAHDGRSVADRALITPSRMRGERRGERGEGRYWILEFGL